MDTNEKILRPCLVCDAPTVIGRNEWHGEMPAAICVGCCKTIKDGRLPWSVVKMLYLLRSAVSNMAGEMELIRRDQARIFSWQKEVDEERVGAS
jgi:hypothetical protein